MVLYAIALAVLHRVGLTICLACLVKGFGTGQAKDGHASVLLPVLDERRAKVVVRSLEVCEIPGPLATRRRESRLCGARVGQRVAEQPKQYVARRGVLGVVFQAGALGVLHRVALPV